MKACFKNVTKFFSPEEIEVLKHFTQFLQEQLQLKKDVHITFVSKRDRDMTTGVRMPHHQIYVLSKDRLFIDILRTLGHEWTHEYQHQKMGVKDDQKIQDIGGPEENMANTLAGIFLKKFDKENPKYREILYGEE